MRHIFSTIFKLPKWISLIVFFVIAFIGFKIFFKDKDSLTNFRLAYVTRGDLLINISATGTVEPEEVVDVGAQVAGKIISFGKDNNGKIIDYGSEIEEGIVLAQIDDSTYLSDVQQAEAQLKKSKADLMQMQAKSIQAENDWKRAEILGPSDALSKSSFDSYKAGNETAMANVTAAKAQIAIAEAVLAKAKRNLEYCIIKSPVKGVIIDRKVNIGQTVVSSLNAPSLFLIAKDLHRMQVWVSVNEVDIGNIFPGQAVSFTVDSFPGEQFEGKVKKVRLNASMSQNVVSYVVEVETENKDGKLLPYLTANVKFEVSNRQNVLLVPNAALRWTPLPEQILGGEKEYPKGKNEPAEKTKKGTIWVPEGDYVKPIRINLGKSDSINTEIESNELKENTPVVIGKIEISPTENKDSVTNPFAPNVVRGGGGRRH